MIIIWHERDLRIEDHEALYSASKETESIFPLFIYSNEKNKWSYGEASKWWLHHTLVDLSNRYKSIGGHLILRKGDPLKILRELCQHHAVKAVYYNERFEPHLYARDQKIKEALAKIGVEMKAFNGSYLIHPKNILNKTHKPYCVFTPFYHTVLKEIDTEFRVFPTPRALKTPSNIVSEKLESLELLPKKNWYKKLEASWTPGREAAKKIVLSFVKVIKEYPSDRDIPSVEGTSKLSPYLHFGEISSNEVMHLLQTKVTKAVFTPFLRQLIWRDFANYFLFHFPNISDENWREAFDRFPWKTSKGLLEKWQQGKTGYPIVDAGMRELWQTGWMHNRVRMVVASFLIKDLMIHWKEGAVWFWDTLVDADLPSNSLNWQWVAGSGPDASPFFRIFNPILQGEKFDPEGIYIRKYIPELSKLSNRFIHKPWEAPEDQLSAAGIVLGEDYPLPIVNHEEKRDQALAAYKKIR